ncbi:MAG: tRNA (N6-threonylcarbamoyladenosine(37)-N6)-methyltransferase TrmO [Clostridia bacterium]|nr:tRNA (N6-threonylcarbamoyladenosine(37)-N6)-methyltransferase TrmO [Clostridia bacterium]
MVLKTIAHIRNDFTAKFGIPRQSGLVSSVRSRIEFTPEYRNADALRGLEGYSHLWLIWEFSEAKQEGWSPTVRPPRLGGNTRMGVFATRSPYRPNSLGLSSVKIEKIDLKKVEITVFGADLLDGTPIFDIKPYLPYTDSHPEAVGGFAFGPGEGTVEVECSPQLLDKVPAEKREGLLALLAQDPRPGYADDPTRVYGMEYAGLEIKFTVGETLQVTEIKEKES